MFWYIETRFQHFDGTHSVRTFIVYGRTQEKAMINGQAIVRKHISHNRYKDAKIVRIYACPKAEKPAAW